MTEVTMFKADDGKVFSKKRECEKYEDMCARITHIMSNLKPAPDYKKSSVAVQQNVYEVKKAYIELMLLCANTIESGKSIFIDCANGIRDISHAARILDDYSNTYPSLNSAFYRIKCTDFKTGIEYVQPYFAHNPSMWKGTLLE